MSRLLFRRLEPLGLYEARLKLISNGAAMPKLLSKLSVDVFVLLGVTSIVALHLQQLIGLLLKLLVLLSLNWLESILSAHILV
jgi:hypothetical protein